MRMNTTAFFVLALALPAHAQQERLLDTTAAPDEKDQISTEGAFSITPLFGGSRPYLVGDDITDESEIGLEGKATVQLGTRISASMVGGATWTPHVFDDDSAESGGYFQLGLEREIKTGDGGSGGDYRGSFTPFVRYRFTHTRDDFFDDYTSTDHVFRVGFTYQNKFRVACRSGGCRAAIRRLPAFGNGKVSIEITPELNYQASPTNDRRRWTPKLTGKFNYPASFGTLYLSAAGEGRFFTHALGAGNDKRFDFKLNLEAGLGLNTLFGIESDKTKVAIAGRFVHVGSNKADAGYDRFYVVPSVSFRF